MKLMILGAGLLQSFVIKRARELGIHTIAVDMDEQAIGFQYADEYRVINIVDQEACLAEARRSRIDGVMTAATDYGVLGASYIAEQMGLPGLPYAAAQIVKNKYSVRRMANFHEGFQFFEIHAMDDLEPLREQLVYPIMVKPCDGSGSKGAGRVDSFAELTVRCEEAMGQSLSGKVLLETFLDGEEYGVESFVLGDDVHVLGVMKKYMTAPPYYAELGHSLPSDLPADVERRIRETVIRTIRAIGITFGSVNMDLLLKDGIPYVVDVGARMGGNLIGSHIVPLATGVDYMGGMIRAHLGEKPDFTPRHGHADRVISTALLALTPGKIRTLPDMNAFRNRDGVEEIVCHKQIGDTIRFYKNNLDGCGYVVASGKTEQEAHALAFSIRDEIDSLIVRE